MSWNICNILKSFKEKAFEFLNEHWRGIVYVGISFVFILLLFTCSTHNVTSLYEEANNKTQIETLKCDSLVTKYDLESINTSESQFTREDAIKQIRGMHYRLTQVLADMRLEFSNQLSGLNMWVALWIAMLAIFGTLTPLIMNYMVRGETKEEMKKIKEETIKEQHKLEYIETNIRLLNVLNSIDSLVYENCSTFGYARPHYIFGVYLSSLIESLRKYHQIISSLKDDEKLQMATLLSVVSGIKHILRQVSIVFTDGIILQKALARVNDLNDLLDINLKILLEKDIECGGKATEEMKSLVLETITICNSSITTLKALLEKDRKSIEPF